MRAGATRGGPLGAGRSGPDWLPCVRGAQARGRADVRQRRFLTRSSSDRTLRPSSWSPPATRQRDPAQRSPGPSRSTGWSLPPKPSSRHPRCTPGCGWTRPPSSTASSRPSSTRAGSASDPSLGLGEGILEGPVAFRGRHVKAEARPVIRGSVGRAISGFQPRPDLTCAADAGLRHEQAKARWPGPHGAIRGPGVGADQVRELVCDGVR